MSDRVEFGPWDGAIIVAVVPPALASRCRQGALPLTRAARARCASVAAFARGRAVAARLFLCGMPRMTPILLHIARHGARCDMGSEPISIWNTSRATYCSVCACARRTPGPGPSTPPPSTLARLHTAQHAVQCRTHDTPCNCLNSIDGIPLPVCLSHRPINFCRCGSTKACLPSARRRQSHEHKMQTSGCGR